MKEPLVEGIDYYLEDGRLVFTERYHLRRGYCCNSRCRHCPYGNARPKSVAAAPADATPRENAREREDPPVVIVGLPKTIKLPT